MTTPLQELEVMLDLFHSFDDSNSGVLKKAAVLFNGDIAGLTKVPGLVN